jgi:hypothetical protein
MAYRISRSINKTKLTKGILILVAIMGLGVTANGYVTANNAHRGNTDLVLTNTKIHTFDKHSRVVSEVRLSDGKVVELGRHVDRKNAKVIDLKGKTVIPGLIDNHTHFVRTQNLIGHDVRELETAFSVASAKDILKKKAIHTSPGEFITAMGGIAQRQFREGRFPSLTELDSTTTKHPILLAEGGSGPTQANTKARDILRGLGVEVADNGTIAAGAASSRAYEVLAASLTDAQRKQQLLRESQYAFSVGLTTVGDHHGSTPGAGFLDRVSGHDVYLDLVREQEREGNILLPRTRFYFPAQQLPELEDILNNRWREFGSDMAKTAGIGEWAPRGGDYLTALNMMANKNWAFQQHLISVQEIDDHLTALEQMRDSRGLKNLTHLQWTLGHVGDITPTQIERTNKLGVGLAPHPWRYLTANTGGPAFRTIVDKATVPVGTGLDGARVAPLNPWTGIYYMVTGKNSGGALVNDGQQITREEAIRLYAGPQQGWFTREQDILGGIGEGRYADLVVLDKDIFSKRAVPDEKIREVKSVLTIINGKIAYSDRL